MIRESIPHRQAVLSIRTFRNTTPTNPLDSSRERRTSSPVATRSLSAWRTLRETEDVEMADPFVLTDVRNQIAWMTLNDPGRLNPVTISRIREIHDSALRLSRRNDVSVVVVTGAGRGFCSGADLSGPIEVAGLERSTSGLGSILPDAPGLWTLSAMQQPVIAMVNGAAVGYGAELALQADIRIVGHSGRFRFPFSMLGTVSDTGAGSWLLPRLIGWSRAAELFYTGRFVDSDESAAIGLANHRVADDDLRQFTTRLAASIAQNSAWSLRTMKRMLFAALDERKREHLVEQYLRFGEGDPDFDHRSYTSRFQRE